MLFHFSSTLSVWKIFYQYFWGFIAAFLILFSKMDIWFQNILNHFFFLKKYNSPEKFGLKIEKKSWGKKFEKFFLLIHMSSRVCSKMDIFISKADGPDILGGFKFSVPLPHLSLSILSSWRPRHQMSKGVQNMEAFMKRGFK